jgi:hypothetical protein
MTAFSGAGNSRGILDSSTMIAFAGDLPLTLPS